MTMTKKTLQDIKNTLQNKKKIFAKVVSNFAKSFCFTETYPKICEANKKVQIVCKRFA